MHASCHKTIPLLEDPKPLKLVDNMSEMLLGGTQSVFANWNNLCHNPIVKEQWRKRWSTVSPCFMHNLHMSGLSALWDLLNCSKSLVLTFLWATNQTKDLTLILVSEHRLFIKKFPWSRRLWLGPAKIHPLRLWQRMAKQIWLLPLNRPDISCGKSTRSPNHRVWSAIKNLYMVYISS